LGIFIRMEEVGIKSDAAVKIPGLGGSGEREGVEGKGRGPGELGRNDPNIVCTYE
jgi:hypothetical protein